MTQTTDTGLPKQITRPLNRAAWALVAFLAGLVVWSLVAPLATTIHVSGTLIATRPSHDLQHPYGGEIAQINVEPQDQVDAGAVLMRFDVQREEKSLAEVSQQIAALEAENALVRHLLNGVGDAPKTNSPLADQWAVAQLTQAAHKRAARALQQQLAASQRQAEILSERVTVLTRLETTQSELKKKGLSREAELESLRNERLELTGELERERAEAIRLDQQAQQSQSDAQTTRAEIRARLLARQQDNTRQLSGLRQEALALEQVLDHAQVRSPIAGQVQTLRFDTASMYVPRGETILTVAQPLTTPRLRLLVPVTAVDQIAVGATGLLTISSLPQREMPRVEVVVTAISPEAEKDSDAQPVGYVALAEIRPESLQRAQTALQDRFRLSADMPVSVALTGRTMTFYEYLIQPFMSGFSGALQD